MSDSAFILDTNVFIEAAHRYYAFDLAPKFWDSLIDHTENGAILSIDRIKIELKRGNDDLAKWAEDHFDHAFASTDDTDIIRVYGQVMSWVNAQPQYSDAAKSEFASGADGWLIAFAIVNNCIVVTQEVSNPDIRRRVPIPNVCDAFNVPYVNTFEMMRRLGVQFD